MKVEIHPAVPLEISKSNLKTWKEMQYQCLAMLGNPKDIKEEAYKLILELLKEMAFIAVWFYDDFLDHNYYLEPYIKYDCVLLRKDFALYEINKIVLEEDISALWGEYDLLDIYFPKRGEECELIRALDSCKNASKYYKKKKGMWSLCDAIITDSGDGDELQIIYRDAADNQKVKNVIENEKEYFGVLQPLTRW